MRKSTPATSPTSLAAEWEEAMLLSCLSPDENRTATTGSTTSRGSACASSPRSSTVKGNSYRYDDDDVGGLLQLSSESSFTSYDSFDSDISLCRNTSRNHNKGSLPQQQQQQRSLWGPPLLEKNSSHDDSSGIHPAATATLSSSSGSSILDIDNDDNSNGIDHNDGDCSSITAVSLANLFLGSGGPCDLHLESDEGVEVVQAELLLTANNTKLNALTSSMSHTRLTTAPRPQQQPQAQQRLLLLADSPSTPPPPSSVSASREDDNTEEHRLTDTALTVEIHGTEAVATTTTAGSSSSITKKSHTVHFGRVHIRQFGISISENPCVSEGPPVELGWDFREQPQPLSVDQYEAIRLPRRRRRLQEFLLSDRERRRMLLARYTHQDIRECIRQVEQIKRQRVLTYLMLPASALDEAAEDMYRYVTRSFN